MTLADTQAALAAARANHDKARIASEVAAADAAALRAKVKSGKAPKVTAAQIAEADAAADHAALVHHGAGVDLPALSAAVNAARVNDACDEVLAELPMLGQDVVFALQAVEAVLGPLVTAAERYDEFVATSLRHLEKVAPNVEPTYEAGSGLAPRPAHGTASSPFVAGRAETPSAEPEPAPVRSRFQHPRHGTPTVDGVALTSCRGPGQLAAVLLQPMRELGGQQGLIELLKLLAAGAPTLPTP